MEVESMWECPEVQDPAEPCPDDPASPSRAAAEIWPRWRKSLLLAPGPNPAADAVGIWVPAWGREARRVHGCFRELAVGKKH